MKKILTLTAFAASMLLASCGMAGLGTSAGSALLSNAGSSALSGLVSSATNPNTLGNIFGSIIGLDKVTAKTLTSTTWKYGTPGCAFISEKTLANAGGEVVASQVKEKLAGTYSKLGISATNTYFQFNADGTFTGQFKGMPLNGTYTFDEVTQTIKLQMMLVSLTGYVKQNTNGIALLFDSTKLLGIMQTLSAASGNSTLSTIGNLSSNYDGLRIGFDLVK